MCLEFSTLQVPVRQAFPTEEPDRDEIFQLTERLAFLVPAMLVGVLLGQQTSVAQSAEVVRVGGQVVSFNGTTLIVKSRAGETVAILFVANWAVGGVVKTSMADTSPVPSSAVRMPQPPSQ
jgi:hypothetical protein